MNPRLTFNIELTSKPDRFGRYSVLIRLHLKGHLPARILTTVRIENPKKYWAKYDPGRKVKWAEWIIRHENRVALNGKIEEEYQAAKQKVADWAKAEPDLLLTPALLAERFRSMGSSDVYYEQMKVALEQAKQQAYTTWRGKRTALNLFIAYAGEQIPTPNVTPQLVRQFQQHLLRNHKVKRSDELIKASSVNTYLDSLHNLHVAMLLNAGVSPKQALQQSPWNDRQRPDESKPIKFRLDEATIEKVKQVRVASNREKMTPELSFTIWMLSHSLAGARFSDVLALRYMHFEVDAENQPVHLRYEMLKTGFVVNMPIFEQARQLLAPFWKPDDHKPTDYVLPFLSNKQPYAKLLTHEQYQRASFEVRAKLGQDYSYWNHQTNVCLREIQAEAGVRGKLTTHTARHSFADLARRIMQEDKTLTLYDIQLMLGHSEYKTTVGYMEELSGQNAARQLQSIYNRVKSKPSE